MLANHEAGLRGKFSKRGVSFLIGNDIPHHPPARTEYTLFIY